MMTDTLHLRDLVSVAADFKPSVQLPFDFDNPAINERLISSFIPTTQTIEIFTAIAQSFNPNSAERARALVGTFGTGKSDLLLMICNYFGRQVDDPLMLPFYERLHEIDPARAGIVKGGREGQPRFLVVLLQADTVTAFPGFVLHGLQHALEKENLAHLMNKTRYSAAREQIETWQREGHARYSDFCKALEEYEKIDAASLVAALSGAQADEALRRFMRTFKIVTGIEFPVYGYSQPHEAYADVAQALVASGNFSGILLVCDEFTAFFERFQSAIDQQLRETEAETKAVENLAERSDSSGRAQIHFFIASLESFASAAALISDGPISKATERSGGRFKRHSLLVQGSEELIRGAIRHLDAARGVQLLPNMQRDELMTTACEIWQPHGRNREWIRDKIVEGAFPLHPLSTYALPLVNQRVAQSQRTMFLFLKDEKGLRGFIQREPLQDEYPNWHRLLTPDLLFDYFRESIITKHSDIHEAFERAEQQVRTATVDKELALRILKVVALCETLGSDLVMRPTRLFLRRALNLPSSAESDLDAALNLLEQVDAIEAPSEVGGGAGVYRLPARGWVSVKNLRQRITNRAQNLSSTDVGKLQANSPPEPVQAADYNRKRGSHRKLSAYYVSPMTLRSRERLKADLEDPRNRDGLLWYVITSSDVERSEAQSLAREITSQQPRLVVAVPVAPTHVLSALRNYQALEALRRDPELDQQSKPYLEDTGKVGREYREQLDRELQLLGESRQWEWYAGGRSQVGLIRASLVNLASQVMEKVFSDTPTTNLAQHFQPDTLGTTIMKAVEQIIKNDIKLVKGSKAPADSVLRVGAVALGLLQPEKPNGSFEIFSVAEPTSSASLASGKIWRRIGEHLAAGKPWATLVRDLRQPHFGLYDSILICFLAAFIARNADSVAIFKTALGSRPLDVEPALLKAMLEKPQDYTLRYHQLSEAERRWLRGIVERGIGQVDFTLSPGTPLRAAVATRIKAWLARQQLPAFAVTLDEQQLAEILPDSAPVALNVVQLLIKNQASDADLAGLLLADLPHLLGAPEQHTAWDQTTVDELLVSWMNVCELLTQLPLALKERTVRRVAALFGAEDYSAEGRWTAVRQWRITRNAVPPEQLQGLARELFRLTNLATGSIEQTLLEDFARRVVTVGVEYQRWQGLEKLEKVFSELTKARDEINRAWEEVAHGDDIWREGLARLASGRAMSGVSAERAAAELANWSGGVTWPACAQNLNATQIRTIYPEINPEAAHDLVRILKRATFDAERWREDLSDGLPKEFGVHGYTKGEVNAALRRIEAILPLAAGLEPRLRRYIMDKVARLFAAGIGAADGTPVNSVIAEWRDHFAIPEPNDLSADAKSLLFHVAAWGDDAETLLLTTLPRVISTVGKPVRQWESFEILDNYIEAVRRLIVEIADYEPLTPEAYAWLTGVIDALHRPAPVNLPRERKRLTDLVAAELAAWLREQQLPPFVADLGVDDLRAVFPNADVQMLATLTLLLCRNAERSARDLVSRDLPTALALDEDYGQWRQEEVDTALERLAVVCRCVEALPRSLRVQLLDEIGTIFAPSTNGTSAPATDLLSQARQWRSAYVILPSASLSANARLLYDTLGGAEDDVDALLLQRLPRRLKEIGEVYGRWPRWSVREQYLEALRAAAQEIAGHVVVDAGSTSAKTLWQEFREGLSRLGEDEQRWVIKTFRDEFQQ